MEYSRDQIRTQFYQAWGKHQQGMILSPLENQIVTVMLEHPEYHDFFNQPKALNSDDPAPIFFHLGMHLTLIDQIQTDRPRGIKAIYEKLLFKGNSPHDTHHLMMPELQNALEKMQHTHQFDEKSYLDRLNAL